MSSILLFIGAGLTAAWGVSHLIPTKQVVAGFGDISANNRHIITMEWITEGVALIFMGGLVVLVTLIDPTAVIARAVYFAVVVGLVALAVISALTGFKVNFLPFKLCPFIFTLSAALIVFGAAV